MFGAKAQIAWPLLDQRMIASLDGWYMSARRTLAGAEAASSTVTNLTLLAPRIRGRFVAAGHLAISIGRDRWREGRRFASPGGSRTAQRTTQRDRQDHRRDPRAERGAARDRSCENGMRGCLTRIATRLYLALCQLALQSFDLSQQLRLRFVVFVAGRHADCLRFTDFFDGDIFTAAVGTLLRYYCAHTTALPRR
jgi:hypothetical protein